MKYENTQNKIKKLWNKTDINKHNITKVKKIVINLDDNIDKINKSVYFNRVIRTFNSGWEFFDTGLQKTWEIIFSSFPIHCVQNIKTVILHDENFIYTSPSSVSPLSYKTNKITDIQEIKTHNGDISQTRVRLILIVYYNIELNGMTLAEFGDSKVKLLVSVYNPNIYF